MIKSDVVIIGGGLAGLTLQYLLNKEGVRPIIIEARNHLGGRIYTKTKDGNAPIEMGATWLGTRHHFLNDLLKELGLDIFPQLIGKNAIYETTPNTPQLVKLPPNEDPSFRIKGGSSALIKVLSESLDSSQLYLNQIITSIKEEEDGLLIEGTSNTFKAKIVVSTIPPFLFKRTIALNPPLPNTILDIMEHTHTWMGESIKVGLSYAAPFWRRQDFNGTIFSNPGPITELYDHSNYEDNLYAVKGFLNNSYYALRKEDRRYLVLSQLKRYYGEIVDHYLDYQEVVWRKEQYTYAEYEDFISPHQNNGHTLYRKPYLNGKLYIAGSETAAQFPGYMDGAVGSAYYVYEQITNGV